MTYIISHNWADDLEDFHEHYIENFGDAMAMLKRLKRDFPAVKLRKA